MNMNSFHNILIGLSAGLAVVGAVSCATGSRSSAGGEVTGVGGTAWAEPTPYLSPIQI